MSKWSDLKRFLIVIFVAASSFANGWIWKPASVETDSRWGEIICYENGVLEAHVRLRHLNAREVIWMLNFLCDTNGLSLRRGDPVFRNARLKSVFG